MEIIAKLGNQKFKIEYYCDEKLIENEELTYFQLGTYLVTHAQIIKKIKIELKE